MNPKDKKIIILFVNNVAQLTAYLTFLIFTYKDYNLNSIPIKLQKYCIEL